MKVSTDVTVEVEYDAKTKRYTASVIQDGKVLKSYVRASKSAAAWNAANYIAYQVSA